MNEYNVTLSVDGNPEPHEVASKIKAAIEHQSRRVNNETRSPNDMVKEFHVKFGQPAPDTLTTLTDHRADFRWDLIHEEYLEVAEALDNHDTVNLVKELADLVYVAYGWAIEMGVDLNAAVQEVHRSNMSKLGSDGKPIYREDGKVLKGPDYFEPNIVKVITRQ